MKRKRCRNIAAFLVMSIALIAVFCLNPEMCLAEEEESDRVPYVTDWGIFDESTGAKISLEDSGVAVADTTEAVFYVEFDHNVAQNTVADLNCSLISVVSNSGSPVASYAWVKDTQLEFQYRRCIFITVTGIDPTGYYHISVAPGITAKNGFTNTSGTDLYFAFPSSGTDYGSGEDGGEEGDPTGEDGGNEEDPPDEGGGNEEDPPDEDGGNEEDPPGEDKENEDNPPDEDGGSEEDPPGEDEENEDNLPDEDGGNEEDPPGEEEQNTEDPEKTPSENPVDESENNPPETVPEEPETDNDQVEDNPPEIRQEDAAEYVENGSRTEETAAANTAVENPVRSAREPEIKPERQEKVKSTRQRQEEQEKTDWSRAGAEIGTSKTVGTKTKTERIGYRIDAGVFTGTANTMNTEQKPASAPEAVEEKAKSNRARLILIASVLIVAAFGAVSEELSFRRRLKRR